MKERKKRRRKRQERRKERKKGEEEERDGLQSSMRKMSEVHIRAICMYHYYAWKAEENHLVRQHFYFFFITSWWWWHLSTLVTREDFYLLNVLRIYHVSISPSTYTHMCTYLCRTVRWRAERRETRRAQRQTPAALFQKDNRNDRLNIIKRNQEKRSTPILST